MEFSPSFGSFTSTPLVQTMGTSEATEQQLASLEKEAFEAIEHLPKQKQDQYKTMVRQGVNKIRMQIANLRAEGKTEYEISKAIITLVHDFKTSNNSFIQKNQLWNTNKEVVINNLKHNANTINNLNSDFGKINRIQFDDESDDYEELSPNNHSQEENSNDNHSNKKQLDNNTFIDPVSDFILSTPPETVFRWTSQLTGAACNSHPTAQKVCKKITSLVPESLKTKRPNALILTASHDHNKAFALNLFSADIFEFKQIERTHNTKYKKISDIPSLCRAIDEEKANGIAIDVLIIRAHGSKQSMTFDPSNKLTIYDSLPKKSCLQNLAPNATIILDSCATGLGGEGMSNIANHIAYHSPKESTVIAPTIPINRMTISSENPLNVEFHYLAGSVRNHQTTYKINKKEGITHYSSSERDVNQISNIND